MAERVSTKRIAINKTEAKLAIIIGIATFIVIFSLVASKALFDQMLYQNKVINQKETALKISEANIAAVDELSRSYQEFAEATTNVLGGNPQGDADKDGDNPRIILDALPSKYDFPALATSLEKLLKDNNVAITSITGNDDEVAQSTAAASGLPLPVEIPFTVVVEVNNANAKDLMRLFERSIRPIQIERINISQNQGNLSVTIDAKTYYQPEKILSISEETVK